MLYSIYGSQEGELAHGLIERKIFPEGGGILIKLVGCSYLFKGYPSRFVMADLAISKDISWFVAGVLEDSIVKLIVAVTLLISRKRAWKSFYKISGEYFKMAYDPLVEKKFIMPDGKDYCKSIKELYRASEVVLDMIENRKMHKVLSKFRDIALMILQFDTAYRFPVQDILPEINVENLKKHTAKELDRVFGILMEREKPGSENEKWGKIRKKVVLAAKIPWTRKWILRFLTEINYNEVGLDGSDWYFVLRRPCYKYGNIPYENRLSLAKRIDKKRGHNIPFLVWVDKPQPPHFEIIKQDNN